MNYLFYILELLDYEIECKKINIPRLRRLTLHTRFG
jgi:hypothetical protein